MGWLSLLIFLPLAGAIAIPLLARGRAGLARNGSLAISLLVLFIALGLWLSAPDTEGYFYLERLEWIPRFGIQYLVALDGISMLLVLLTALLTPIAVLVSWHSVKHHWPAFAALLLASEAGIMGVFLALDLVLFYIFWELMLVPMYFLVGIWGHERRIYAAYKFFLFTVTGSLLMLVTILGLYFAHGTQSGNYTFDYFMLMHTPLQDNRALWLMLGFVAAFAVKIPMFPVHSWLPDAHTEAPTAGSILLAGLLLKTGAYGMLRFAVPLFPGAAQEIAPYMMTLAVIGILYGALLCLVQEDMKRLIAYSSISHLGFVVLGIFAGGAQGLNGALLLMLAHGVTTGALFALVGMLEERANTRLLTHFGGLLGPMPRFAVLLLLFTLSAMGMPGLANFAGEFLVLAGAYQADSGWAVAGALGIIAAVIYLLWMYQRVALGEPPPEAGWPDLDRRETAVLTVLALMVLWLGLYPVPFLDAAAPALDMLANKGVTVALH